MSAPFNPGDPVRYFSEKNYTVRSVGDDTAVIVDGLAWHEVRLDNLQLVTPGKRLVEIDDAEIRAIEEARDRLRAAHQEWCEWDAPCRCAIRIQRVDGFLARTKASKA